MAITVLIGAIALVAGATIWSGFAGILVPLAIQFTIVTAIFVWIDRRWIRDPDGWDPRTVTSTGPDIDVTTLDGISDQLLGKAYPRAVSIAASILEFGIAAVVLTVALQIGVPEQIEFFKPGPGWEDVYVPAIAVLVVSLIVPVVTLIRPRWTRFRVASHAAIDIAVVVIGLVSLALGNWVVLVDPATATADEVSFVEAVNSITRISIAVAVVLTAVSAALEIRRLIQMRTAG